MPITLLAWYDFKWWVFGLYIASALTDFFDGWFARRAVPSTSRTDLDGLADLLFSAMTLVWIWQLFPDFFPRYWGYFPVLIGLELYLMPMRIRHPHLTTPHLQFGRFAMGAFLFLLPILIVWGDVPWIVHAVLIIGAASKMQLVLKIAERRRAAESVVD